MKTIKLNNLDIMNASSIWKAIVAASGLDFNPNVTFEVTKDHIKLLKRLHVDITSSCEENVLWGRTPCVDFKRPFGNSDIVDDVGSILKWKRLDKENEYFSEEQQKQAIKIFSEMPIVVQIAIKGNIKPGIYFLKEYYDCTSWTRKKNNVTTRTKK